MSHQGLFVDTKAAWFAAFQQEVLGFPMAKHDDIVDCLSLIGLLVAQLLPGQRPQKQSREWDPSKDPYQTLDPSQFEAYVHGGSAQAWIGARAMTMSAIPVSR